MGERLGGSGVVNTTEKSVRECVHRQKEWTITLLIMPEDCKRKYYFLNAV